MNWLYRNKFTIAASNVAGAATSFPVLINSTRQDWRSTPNGGDVASDTGWDFVFTSSDGFTKLDHEIEKFASSTGELVAWVKVPFLSSTSNTVLYAYYGNAVAEDQQNVAAVWGNAFQAVFHLPENPTAASPQFKDSVADSKTGTSNGSQVAGDQQAGKMDGAINFDGTNDYINVADNAKYDLAASGKYAWSFWVKPDDFEEFNAVWVQNDSDPVPTFDIYVHTTSDTGWGPVTQGVSVGWVINMGEELVTLSQDYVFQTGKLSHVLITYDGALTQANRFKIYVDGTDVTAGNAQDDASLLDIATANIRIGANVCCAGEAMDGVIDDMRFANALRSTSWITTEYANQSSPEAFYSIDPSEPLRGATASERSLTLSDSRPGKPANHTFNFTVSNSITASTTLVFEYPSGFTFGPTPSWYNSSWGYRKKLTIDPAKIVGNDDLVNFPVLVSSTIASWRHTSWGGHVASATGWDFVFTASDGTTKLDHEIEKFASTTGELVAWVRVPTLERESANQLYIYYGGPTTTDQQNVHGVWDANYVGVWHMAATSSQTNLVLDSTANSSTGTKPEFPQPYSTATGIINGAQDFDGIGDSIGAGSPDVLDDLPTKGGLSISVWANARSFGEAGLGHLVTKHDINSGNHGWQLFNTVTNSHMEFIAEFNGGVDLMLSENFNQELNTWIHWTVTWDGGNSAQGARMFKNGVEIEYDVRQDATGTYQSDASPSFRIGNDSGLNRAWGGGVDEVRVSNTVRSVAWVQTEYANQSSPVTFYTLGGEEDNGVFDCADVDVATGTEFILGISPNCTQTATTWGVTFATSSRTLTITSPAAKDVYVETGSYTGNDQTRSIAHSLGTEPKVVMVWRDQDQVNEGWVLRTDKHSGGNSIQFPTGSADSRFASDMITGADAAAFSLGTASSVNESGGAYQWIAYAGLGVATGNYTGDGNDDRNIPHGIGTAPKVLFVWPENSSNFPENGPCIRTDQYVGDASYCVNTGISNSERGANFVQAMSATSFQVGSDDNVNEASDAYKWFALTGPSVDTGSYTGDGNDDRNIPHGLSAVPSAVSVWRDEGTVNGIALRSDQYAGDVSVAFDYGSLGDAPTLRAADNIQDMNSANFQVGQDGAVNEVAAYQWYAVKNSPPLIPAGTQMTVRIGTNASFQEQGNSKIVNPSAVGTYRVTLSGTAGSSGDFRVSINGGLLVEATIAETLSLSVSSIGAASCTADDGASITAITTNTATTVPPTFIQEAETTWNTDTSPTTTASFNVQAGDVLVAFAIIGEASSGNDVSISGGSLTWTEEQRFDTDSNQNVWIAIWTTLVDSDKSMSVTFSCSGCDTNNLDFGGNVLTFRGASGIGATDQNNNGSGSAAPSLNFTTTQANSAIVVANGDWNASDGSSRVWRENAGTFTEQTYFRDAAVYTNYGGYHANAGSVGTYELGLTAPSTQRYGIVAVEVKGTTYNTHRVPFGTINANTFYQGCHDLQVSTNAGGGYSLAGLQNHQLQTLGGVNLPDTTCNTGTCTATTAATWTNEISRGLGHTCRDITGSDCTSSYGSGLYFCQFADMSSGETPVSIMASTTPAIATSRIKYRLNRGTNQAAGTYTNTISYSVMATY